MPTKLVSLLYDNINVNLNIEQHRNITKLRHLIPILYIQPSFKTAHFRVGHEISFRSAS